MQNAANKTVEIHKIKDTEMAKNITNITNITNSPKIPHTLQNLETNPPKYTLNHDKTFLKQTAINLETLPQQLKHQSSWLLWTPKTNNTNPEKIIKAPIGGTNWQNKTDDYAKVIAKYTKQIKIKPTGIGFVFNRWHPYIVIDIDSLNSKANLDLIVKLNSYTEYSPSLKGVHVWVQLASLDDKDSLESNYGGKQFLKKHKRDLFISSGYVTMTGNPYLTTNARSTLKAHIDQDIKIYTYQELTNILSKYFNPKLRVITTNKEATDDSQGNLDPALNYSRKRTKAVTAEVARLLLRKIDVRTLTDDIFDRVYHPIHLAILDPQCRDEARTPWLTICQAIHHNFQGGQDGILLLHEWSKKGDKYDKSALNSVYESFSVEPQFLNPVKPVTIASLISLVKAQTPEFVDTTPKGKPLGTLDNLNIFFKFFKYRFKYNVITMDTEIAFPEKICDTLRIPHEPIASLDTATRIISSELLKLGFTTNQYSSLRGSIEDHAKRYPFNPIEEYFKNLKHIYDPKKNPFADLMKTIKLQKHAQPPPHTKAINLFFRKWLIQVAAAACTSNTYSDRIFNNLLIFTGDQGIGKTKWVQALFPKKIQSFCAGSGSLDVHSFRTDRVKQAMELQGTLICNINEIDTLFQPKKYSAFKQLLDENTNKMVMPYGRQAVTMIRRTVFIGSTNRDDFLVDHTGNRRIAIIPTESLDYDHTIDLDQLWAHVMHWYDEDKEKWWLEKTNPDELAAIATQSLFNNQNMYIGDEFLVEDFDSYFDTEARSYNYNKWTYKQVRSVIPSLAQLKINSHDFKESRTSFTLWLKQTAHGKIIKKAKTTRAAQFYLVPPIRSAENAASFRQAAQEYADNEEEMNRKP